MKIFEPQTLQALKEHCARDGSPVLSVYLNIDPTLPVNARGGYKTMLGNMLEKIERSVEKDDQLMKHFSEDAEWVKSRIDVLIPRGKTYVAFCDVSEDFYFEEEIPIRLPNAIFYEDTPYVRPIMEAMDEYERYGVVLLDREKARFFVVMFGQIEEIEDAINIPPVRHRKTAGTDHMRSQMVFQRRSETWNTWFLKEIGERLRDLVTEYNTPHLILMGPHEVTSEFYRLLPKALQEKVIDRLRMAVKAKAQEVLEAIAPVIERRERFIEDQTVEDLVTAAQKSGETMEKALLGLNPVLSAINQGRVYMLVYSSGFTTNGYYCPKCEVILDHVPENELCPYCSSSLERTEDLVWLASEKVLASGGKVEEVRSEQAKVKLDVNGHIGAFLR